MAIRHLPAQDSRVETGSVQFGDDWPGVFIRGDSAFWFVGCIDAVLAALSAPHGDKLRDGIAVAGLQGLRATLADSDLTGLAGKKEGYG